MIFLQLSLQAKLNTDFLKWLIFQKPRENNKQQ